MKNHICTFVGHSRFIPDSMFGVLVKTVEDFACSTDLPIFLVGGMGEFDEMSAKAVRTVKRKFPEKSIRLCLVSPYMKNSLNKDKGMLEKTI